MKQQCHISMIYLSWALYVGGLAASALVFLLGSRGSLARNCSYYSMSVHLQVP